MLDNVLYIKALYIYFVFENYTLYHNIILIIENIILWLKYVVYFHVCINLGLNVGTFKDEKKNLNILQHIRNTNSTTDYDKFDCRTCLCHKPINTTISTNNIAYI